MPDDSGALLVVDDEQFLREAVAMLLGSLGFTVMSAGTGTQALRAARARHFDLLILDVMLPDLDGFEIVQRLRKDRNQVPVIFLTAKDTREDKVAGLTMGGDDYLTKPFHLDELAARVRTILRRTRPVPEEPVLTFADITLDQDKYEVRRGGQLIELSPTEFRLLRYFMLNPGRVLTHAQLLANVWDQEYAGSNKVVATYVVYLRRKLADTGTKLIHTQHAIGYSLRLPRPEDDDEV
jgi:two-component system, OmpR family, response regulator